MRRAFWVVLTIGFLLSGKAEGQSVGDSILANETALQRPLNVHRAQLRVTGSYALTAVNKYYDPDGFSSSLTDLGLGRSRHRAFLDLRFGITEHLEIYAGTKFGKETIRETTQQVFGYPDLESSSIITSVSTESGIEHIYGGLAFRLPLSTKRIDIVPFAGVLIPIASSEGEQPDHELIESEYQWNINYRFHQPLSKGILGLHGGGAVKYRGKRWGLTLRGSYTQFLGEYKKKDWQTQLNAEGEFEYFSEQYLNGAPKSMKLSALIELQASPYFQLFIEGFFDNSWAAWYEWEGVKYKVDDIQLFSLGSGFDLIITPRVWLRERVFIPIMGKGTEAGINVQTSIVYNLFVK